MTSLTMITNKQIRIRLKRRLPKKIEHAYTSLRASVGAHQRASVGAAHVMTSRPAGGTRTCAIVHGCIVKRCTQAAS